MNSEEKITLEDTVNANIFVYKFIEYIQEYKSLEEQENEK